MLKKLIIGTLAAVLAIALAWFILFPPVPASLIDKTWYLKSVETGQGELIWKPKFSNLISLTFTPEGIRGSVGCNDYRGDYQRVRFTNYVFIWNLFRTLVNCLDQEVEQQGTQYLDALHRVTHYELRGSELRLYLTNSSGILIFKPTANP